MSEIEKASQDAVAAARQGDTYAVVLAALHAQQQAQPPACQHQQAPAAVQQSGSAAKWIGIGIGGSFLAVSLAVSMVAFAIGAVSVTICALVLRSVWQDMRKEH